MVVLNGLAPAFVVPFVFTLDPRGMAILLQGSLATVLWVSIAAILGVGALSSALGGWMREQASMVERLMAIAAAVLLFIPRPVTAVAGAALLGLTAALHWTRTGRGRAVG
jgi:TRAP-type uncharacterized transport system fused permease subunit